MRWSSQPHKDNTQIRLNGKRLEIVVVGKKVQNFGTEGPGDIDILQSLSGDKFSFGVSGSGKSTLINLLSGFLTPKNGEITIQKQDAKTLNIPDWHKQLIYIPQNPYVFTASLRDNVAFYTPKASDDEIKQAIHVVGLDDLVKELPDGLDTITFLPFLLLLIG